MKLKFKLNLQQFGGQGFLNLTPTSVTIDDKVYNTQITGTGGNFNLSGSEIESMIKQIRQKGRPLTREEMKQFIQWFPDDTGKQDNILRAQNQIINNNADLFGYNITNIDPTTFVGTPQPYTETPAIPGQDGLTPPGSTEPGSVNVSEDQIGAFNTYYNDIYSLQPGTGGANMLSRLEQSYANQAQQQATMADVGFQQAALQQASTVKQITDQVRAERLARLRAGMSESQIANQDMQMLMTNVNTLNQNAQLLNDQRLQAQIGMNTAQDQAYAEFLAQSNQRGQVGAAMAASDAGDAYQQTIRQMTTLYGADPSKWTAQQWTETSNRVATGNPRGTSNT
jgi:hypothetical protein